MRRGKPSLHKAFGEATATLAGDALLTLAFGLIAALEAHGDPFVRCEVVAKLAAAAGYGGMIGGQMMDIALQRGNPAQAEITRLARMKTAALLTFCCESGAIMGKSSAGARQALSAYGQELGLACQIADDLFDLESDAARTGKPLQKGGARGQGDLGTSVRLRARPGTGRGAGEPGRRSP